MKCTVVGCNDYAIYVSATIICRLELRSDAAVVVVRHFGRDGLCCDAQRCVCFHQQRPKNSIEIKRLLPERADLFLFKNDNYTKPKHRNNKQNVTRMLFTV